MNNLNHSIYFIQSKEGAIKIGVSSEPNKRLKALQTGHHEKLEIMSTMGFEDRIDAYELEYKLHCIFSHLNITGEWFRPAEDLLYLIQNFYDIYSKGIIYQAYAQIKQMGIKNRIEAVCFDIETIIYGDGGICFDKKLIWNEG